MATISDVVELSGSAQAMRTTLRQMFLMVGIVPENKVDDKIKEFLDVCFAKFGEHFTQKEIDGLVAFYQSPLGMAMAQKQPLLHKLAEETANEFFAKERAA